MTDYPSLKAAVTDWLHRSDLDAVVPALIGLAETRMNRDLRLMKMERLDDGTSIDGRIDVPADLVEIKRLYTKDRDLVYAAGGEYHKYYGDPHFYTQVGREYVLIPHGDCDYHIHYYARIPRLSEDQPTSWLLTDAPDLYLYGALIEATPYIKDDARVALWAEGYRIAAESLLANDRNAGLGDSGLAIRSPW